MLTLGTGGAAIGRSAILAFRRRQIIRELHGLPETLTRAGGLELKFAVTKKEIRAVQKMRYRVFFEEGGASAGAFARAQRRDNCPFDRICDHLIVVDHEYLTRRGRRKSRVVGAYRVLRQEAIANPAMFYAAGEFDVAGLLARHPDKKFLELGRSCVLPEYRARRVIDLLWRGVWTYVRHHNVDVMFGCASLPGTDSRIHAEALEFLRTHARASEDWRAPAVRREPMRQHAPATDAVSARRFEARDARRALANLPPLVKGYLRLGALFGGDAFVDHTFQTTDVLVVLPVSRIDARYIEHFGNGAAEASAA
jgi:putative hemolysin